MDVSSLQWPQTSSLNTTHIGQTDESKINRVASLEKKLLTAKKTWVHRGTQTSKTVNKGEKSIQTNLPPTSRQNTSFGKFANEKAMKE